MALHNADYQHWDGGRKGIWSRRAVIAANGLKACLASKWLRRLLAASWFVALAQVAVLFFVGQLLVPDSLAARTQDTFNPQVQTILRGLVAWLEQHPEVSVRVAQDFLFYELSGILTLFTMLGIGLGIPHLITRDLSSKAIMVYSSKAVSRWDYVLGKTGTVLGVISLTWLAPICFSWFLGNLLAPHWNFFWHSRLALIHALSYGLCGALILSCLALGVSAISSREKVTVTAWLVLWLVGRVFSTMGRAPREVFDSPVRQWLQHASTTYNLEQISSTIFRLKDDLDLAQNNIPLFGQLLRGVQPLTMSVLRHPDIAGAIGGVLVMILIAAILVTWRVKPE